MPSIDERIVSMAFENRKFEASVAVTMATLSKLNDTLGKIGQANTFADIEKAAGKVTLEQPMSALDKLRTRLFGASKGAAEGLGGIEQAGNKVTLEAPMSALDKLRTRLFGASDGAAQSFNDIERASSNVSLSNLTGALDSVTAKFSILRGAASVALGNIASRAAASATSTIKSLTLTPVLEGFHNYETQINAVQTIMANTGLTGKKGLGTVQAALNNLNEYANKTVYNFSEMARNIGTFTAAGVKLGPAVNSIKGIANLAALSGSNSQQASSAMYQLSQAIAAGRVNLQDWNSVVNAGMGGAVFQKALLRTGQAMGTIKKGAVEIDKATGRATVNGESFRQSISAKPGQQSWLTSDVLVKTLEQFTGDMSDATLKAQGFSDSQIKMIQTQAKAANAAAVNIKTFSQLMQALKEEVATAWATISKTLFGNIFDATKLFSGIHNVVQNALTGPIYNLNKVLERWAKLGGRVKLLDALKQGFKDLKAVFDPIKKAFRDIFPPTTAKQLLSITNRFHDLMGRLKIGPETADKLRRTFRGLFALLDIGRKIVGGVVSVFAHMLGIIGHGAGGFLSFTATVGDALVVFRDWLNQGDRLKKFFAGIGTALAVPAKLISTVFDAIGKLFNADPGTHTADNLNKLNQALDPTARLATIASNAWNGLKRVLQTVAGFLAPITKTLGDALSQVGQVIATAFNSGNVDKMLAGLQTGLIAGIFLSIRKALKGGTSFNFKAEISGLSDALGIMTGSLRSMQTAIKANILLQIAAAVGILAFSVAILAKVDSKKLASSMTAMAVGLAQLVAAMAILGKGAGKGGGFLKLPVIAASMILLSTALLVLTGTMLIMSRMNWKQITKGLAGVSGLLLGLSVAVEPMSKASPGLIAAGTGMIAVAVALTVLAGAMKIFATMKWEEIAKGLVAVDLALSIIGISARALGPQLLLTGPGLILLAVGLAELAGVIKLLGSMDVVTLAKGIGAIAAGLVAIGLAMDLMPVTLPITAAGLILVGVALTALTGVIALLGSMKVSTLAKGIGAIGAALLVLAVGLTAMVAALPGAVALLAAATALAIFAPTLALLGNMKWSTIGKGLAVVAASMVVIGVAGIVAAPALVALGLGLAALGLGVLALGAGVNLLAKGFAILGNSGKGLAIFTASITALIAVIPKMAIEFVKGIIEIADSVVKLAPPLVAALAKIIDILIALVIKEVPKFGLAVQTFINTVALVIINTMPNIVAAGMAIILGLLRGIDQNIAEITNRAIDIVVKFLGVLASHAKQFVGAGVRLIVNVLRGIASRAGRLVSAATHLITRFLNGIARNIPRVIRAGARVLGSVVTGIAQGFSKLVSIGARAIIHFLSGIAKNVPKVIAKAVSIAGRFVRAVARGLVRLADVGARAVINFINGLADVIEKRGPQLRHAGFRLARAIMDGMTFGISKLGPKAFHAVTHVAGGLLSKAGKVLGIGSPSKEFHKIGAWSMLGLTNGLTAGGLDSEKVVARTGNRLLAAVRKTLTDIPTGLDNAMDFNPTISPVLDLSAVHKEAQNMPNLNSSVGLSTDVSLHQASAILAEKAASDKAQTETAKKPEQPIVKFEQNNYSPESLSTAEIYRRTNNQLSRVKKKLHAAPA